jgi:exosortase/archaeosortase family protein
MEEETKKIISLVSRYVILILVAIPNLYIFYKIFTPVTVNLVYYSLKIFFDVSLSANTISFNPSCLAIELIPACIAGSAYYLLMLLNFSTSNITLIKRIILLIISFLGFLILNVIRIDILSVLLLRGSDYFDFSHRLSWYLVSTVLVVVIWFSEVKLFKIKEIPVYSDIKYLLIKSKLVEE